MRVLILAVAASLLLAACSPSVSTSTTTETAFPEPTDYVVDQAAIISEVNEAEMKNVSSALAQNSGPEVAVVTVKTIGNNTIEGYAIKLAEKWKVGKAGIDNGAIIVIAVEERKVRIEVGRGVEDKITDAEAGRIIQNDMVPELKNNNWDKGIRNGFDKVVSELK